MILNSIRGGLVILLVYHQFSRCSLLFLFIQPLPTSKHIKLIASGSSRKDSVSCYVTSVYGSRARSPRDPPEKTEFFFLWSSSTFRLNCSKFNHASQSTSRLFTARAIPPGCGRSILHGRQATLVSPASTMKGGFALAPRESASPPTSLGFNNHNVAKRTYSSVG